MHVFKYYHVSTGNVEGCFVITISDIFHLMLFLVAVFCSPACVRSFLPGSMRTRCASVLRHLALKWTWHSSLLRWIWRKLWTMPLDAVSSTPSLLLLNTSLTDQWLLPSCTGEILKVVWLVKKKENKEAGSFLPFIFRKKGPFSVQIFRAPFCVHVVFFYVFWVHGYSIFYHLLTFCSDLHFPESGFVVS